MNLKKTITIILITLAPLLKAEALTCKVQLMHDFCSSGLVKIDFSESDLTYKFHQGDAHCWGGDYDVTGKLNHLGPNYPYFVDATYELLVNKQLLTENVVFAKISYDPAVKMATVQLLTDSRHNQRVYNLNCE